MKRIINYFGKRIIRNIQLKGTTGKYKYLSVGLWKMAGNMAERFYEKDSAYYDIIQEEIYFELLDGLYEIFD